MKKKEEAKMKKKKKMMMMTKVDGASLIRGVSPLATFQNVETLVTHSATARFSRLPLVRPVFFSIQPRPMNGRPHTRVEFQRLECRISMKTSHHWLPDENLEKIKNPRCSSFLFLFFGFFFSFFSLFTTWHGSRIDNELRRKKNKRKQQSHQIPSSPITRGETR